MLFWKRLCRPNSTNRRQSAVHQERRFFGILRTGKRKVDDDNISGNINENDNENDIVDNIGNNIEEANNNHVNVGGQQHPPIYRRNADAVDPIATGYEDASTIELRAQENDYVIDAHIPIAEDTHCRVRSPPPFYCPLPLTPPPSYTERPQAGPQPLAERSVPDNAGHANRYVEAETAAARQQARRRRRLRELQQEQHRHHQQHHRFASSTDSSSGSSSSTSSSDCELLGTGTSPIRRQQRRRHSSSRDLRDAYCPDLLHACALILHQQPITSDSSVGNFTATPPPTLSRLQSHGDGDGLDTSSDYVEIDELLPLVAAVRAKSTPHLQHAVGLDEANLAMGQNLSLRRPRISLTWVLREQQQQQQQTQQQQQQQTPNQTDTNEGTTSTADNTTNATPTASGDKKESLSITTQQRTEPVPTQLDVSKKRYRVKQLPGGTEPLNGYATTPTAHQAPTNGHLANQKFFSNQNLLDYKDKTVLSHRTSGAGGGGGGGGPVAAASTKELLFVCTPQRAPKSDAHSEALLLARKRNEIRKKLASRLQQARSQISSSSTAQPGSVAGAGSGESSKVEQNLKCTYSEPSLVAASEVGANGVQQQQQRRHRHRKRRERNRGQRFGYEIHNVEEFLSRCSLGAPGNIPVVLATASTLYQTRPGGYQLEIPLPLGMVVNAVFKNQNWLYVQTPHAEEGYVGYACCLPLGILPPAGRGSSSRHTPCWESNADVFPRPCGNMTDSEKEIRLRGGTRSDGARTPRNSKTVEELMPLSLNNNSSNNNINHNNNNNHVTKAGGSSASSLYGEQHVDKLYLRAASQPKLVEKAYAQLRSTKQVGGLASGSASVRSGASNDEYVTLQQQQQQQQRSTQKKHLHQSSQLTTTATRRLSNVSYITNGHNGQHLHPKTMPPQQQQQSSVASAGSVLSVLRRQQQQHNGLRQTLVAINSDYITESIAVHKGEIVTLCECRESKDQRQWFYVKTRDGREGFIPAEVAGHGYL